MTIKSDTIRPGLLVSLKTSVNGNVSYDKRIIEAASVDEKTGVQKARWETVRTTINPVEHEDARLAQSKASSIIRRVCKASTFGLLCPEADAEELEKAIADARQIAADFNKTAKLSRISLYVITGRIAANDIEAVKAINSEISALLLDMEQGVGDADVKVVREAASKAKAIAEMLSAEARVQAEIAIEAARKAAREIVKAEGKGAVDKRTMRTIAEARKVFLDLDEPAGEIAAPKAKARVVDLAAE